MAISYEILQSNPQLVKIADTPGLVRLCLGCGESWEQQGRKDGDDGNDDQQLNQRESTKPATIVRAAI